MPILKEAGKQLIKIYRGEGRRHSELKGKGFGNDKTFGRWFSTKKETAEDFAKDFQKLDEFPKGSKLKSVDITEEDLKIGNKVAKKLAPNCVGADCNVILPKKYLDKIDVEEFKLGGIIKGFPKLTKRGWK
jgi:hypothetical protein